MQKNKKLKMNEEIIKMIIWTHILFCRIFKWILLKQDNRISRFLTNSKMLKILDQLMLIIYLRKISMMKNSKNHNIENLLKMMNLKTLKLIWINKNEKLNNMNKSSENLKTKN
jgi:hypothetical protein